MSDLLLDNEGDLLIENGKVSLISQEEELTAQRLLIKFKTYKGEWYLDLSQGVPYFQSIFRRGNNSKIVADTTFKSIINNDPSIVKLKSFSSTVDSDGLYSMSFRALSISGEIITVEQSIQL